MGQKALHGNFALLHVAHTLADAAGPAVTSLYNARPRNNSAAVTSAPHNAQHGRMMHSVMHPRSMGHDLRRSECGLGQTCMPARCITL